MKESVISRPTAPSVDDEKLKADLAKYCQMALDAGAEEAIVVSASDIVQNIRNKMLCYFPSPPCRGTSYWCQINHDLPMEITQAIQDSFKYAVVSMQYRKREAMAGPAALAAMGELEAFLKLYKNYWDPQTLQYWQDYLNELVARKDAAFMETRELMNYLRIGAAIVIEARKDGHYYAFGKGSGVGCAMRMCGEKYDARCVAINTGLCRFPGRMSPCSSTRTDLPRTVQKLGRGWRFTTAGWSTLPEDLLDLGPPGIVNIAFIE